ncbi:MAG: AzlD domain-containing protein [Coriobacteriia bacterium]
MSASYVWAVVASMAVANYTVRFLPIALVSRLRLPKPLERWLSYVPVSVMAALVAVAVLRPEGRLVLGLDNPRLLAALPTAFVFHRTRSFLGATLVGVAAFLALRALLG